MTPPAAGSRRLLVPVISEEVPTVQWRFVLNFGAFGLVAAGVGRRATGVTSNWETRKVWQIFTSLKCGRLVR